MCSCIFTYFENSTGSTPISHISLTFQHPPVPPPVPRILFSSRTPAVVMAMESASASAPGVVAMEMPVRGALPVVEEDEGYSAPSPGSEERLRHRRGGGGGGRRRRGVPFNRASYYMLIVIGEIGSEQQLDAAREHIERGECRTGRRWSPAVGRGCQDRKSVLKIKTNRRGVF